MTNSDKTWCDHMISKAIKENHAGSVTLNLHTSEEKAAYIVYKLSVWGSVVHTSRSELSHNIVVTFA